MKKILLDLALSLCLALGCVPAAIAAEGARSPRFLVELSAGPLLGIDEPLRGCEGSLALGIRLQPFEAGLRAGTAYDGRLQTGSFRLDLELGLGSGLRALIGALLPFGEAALPDPSGTGLVPVTAGDWPNRFGFASTLFVLPRQLLRAQALIDAELVYTDYSLPRGSAASAAGRLSGAAAFAAGIEAGLSLRLRWSP
jgi:hypothetical protein